MTSEWIQKNNTNYTYILAVHFPIKFHVLYIIVLNMTNCSITYGYMYLSKSKVVMCNIYLVIWMKESWMSFTINKVRVAVSTRGRILSSLKTFLYLPLWRWRVVYAQWAIAKVADNCVERAFIDSQVSTSIVYNTLIRRMHYCSSKQKRANDFLRFN